MSPAFQQFPDMIEIAIRTEHPGAETLHDQVGELARIPTIALMIRVEVGGSLAIGGSARQEIPVKCIELRGQGFGARVGIQQFAAAWISILVREMRKDRSPLGCQIVIQVQCLRGQDRIAQAIAGMPDDLGTVAEVVGVA